MSTQITISGQVPYKSYVAIVRQNGNNPPGEIVVLENTIGPITWVYIGPGNYQIQLIDAFPFDKVFCPNVLINNRPEFLINSGGDTDYIDFTTSGDNLLGPTPLEIRVYN